MLPNPIVAGKELVVTGRLLRTARLRHEWCDFISSDQLPNIISGLTPCADVFTYVNELGTSIPTNPNWAITETAVAVLSLSTYDDWWTHLGFKPRNKVRKAEKYGIQFKTVSLDHAFAVGVEAIYNECPVKQGRKFVHFGQRADEIQSELSSFAGNTVLVGAYMGTELVGFMKLFHGGRVLRTVHIIGSSKHKEKCIMDGLIAKAVEIGCNCGCTCLHYGSWTDGGIGAFREKHGFVRQTTTRVFVPLTWRGRHMLRLNLHRPLRDRLPPRLVSNLRLIRGKWHEGFAAPKHLQPGV